MTAITITDLNNAKEDVDHIAAIATSTAATAIDRLGNTKSTVAAAIDAIKAFNSRGAWVTATVYAVKDIVTSGGTWYACVVAHTSSAAFATDIATKWRVHQGVTAGELAATTGAAVVGASDGRTLQENLNEPVFSEIAKGTKASAMFTEYHNTRPGNNNVKVAVGMLGNPEANVSVNMDYTTNVHKYYDSSRAAMWFAISPDAFAMQYAATGADPSGDCWTLTGSKYLFGGSSDGRFFINSVLGEARGDCQLRVKRASGKASIGGAGDLVLEGSNTAGVAGVVLLNALSTGNVSIAAGGGLTGVRTLAPINAFEVATATSTGTAGADGMAVTDGQAVNRLGLNFGVNTAGLYGWIQASQGGVGFKNLAFMPAGGSVVFGSATFAASAKVAIDSTTQGFLPPRMTTTQKNAIAAPAAGLIVYDTTLGKLCVRGASAWETITSA